jgi:uncharacterized protein (TIGR02271 family)
VIGRGGDGTGDAPAVVRHEEELAVGTAVQEAGRVGVRKVSESHAVETVVPRGVEHAEVERQDAADSSADSGEVEVLPDGSLSIPVFEEELVIEKRLVVRERIIVRKHTVTEDRRVEADLRRERVEVEADAEVVDRVTPAEGAG